MKCLVVTTHPLDDSLCKKFTAHVVTQLERNGHQVTVEDLYNTAFEPVLTVAERSSYYGTRFDSSLVKLQADRLRQAEALVLLFPTWWFGFPAMLKGWFDRVWGPGIAFDHARKYGPIKPRLEKLNKTLVITTLGSPWWVDRLVMRQPVKRIIKLALLGACARNSNLQFLSLYNCEKLHEKDIRKFSAKIQKKLEAWR